MSIKTIITKRVLPVIGLMFVAAMVWVNLPARAQETTAVNIIRNPNFESWPAGDYFTNIPHKTETAEDWVWGKGSAVSTWDVYKSIDAPEGYEQSAKIEVLAGEATAPSGSNPHLRYMFFGYEVAQMKGKEFDLSFWVKSSLAGTHSFVLHNPRVAGMRTIAKEYNIAAPHVWERKTVRVNVENGTYEPGVGGGLKMRFCFGASPGYSIQPNTWINGNYVCSVNQVALYKTTDNYINFAGVEMVEVQQ